MIPITVAEIKQITNLEKLTKDDFITTKLPVINALMKDILLRKYYSRATKISLSSGEGRGEGVLFKSAIYTAFAYFTYAECLEFLNTNTSGSGIITSTGFADSKQELLPQDDSFKRRNTLEFKAYSVIRGYLNEIGLKRYNDLKLWDDLQRAGTDGVKMTSSGRIRMVIV